MITGIYKLRPSYGEVDKMGYVYHANYVSYCHRARTELMRAMGIADSYIESRNVMMPVISFDIKYKKSACYDEVLTIKTTIKELPKIRFTFEFEIRNEQGELITTASSSVVFVEMESRKPLRTPDFVDVVLQAHDNSNEIVAGELNSVVIVSN